MKMLILLSILVAQSYAGSNNPSSLAPLVNTQSQVLPYQGFQRNPHSMIKEFCNPGSGDYSSFLQLDRPSDLKEWKKNYGAKADEALEELKCLRMLVH
jgi:hypothetical protein